MDDEERVIAVLQSAGMYSPLTHIKLYKNKRQIPVLPGFRAVRFALYHVP